MLTLKTLQELGAVVAEAPVPTEIRFKLDDDVERVHTVFVKKLSIGDTERIFLAADDDEQSRTAKVIAQCVTLGEDGKEVIPYVKAYQFHPAFANALIRAIGSVNRLKHLGKDVSLKN